MKLLRPLPLALLAAAPLVLVACGDGPDEAGSVSTSTAKPAGEGTPIVLANPTTTSTGLQYVDQVVGSGKTPTADDIVTVHYVGRLAANGKQFDSSVDRGQPAQFRMGGVIPGFAEALSTMKEGGKRTALLPANLAYGKTGYPPDIPPDAALVFEIQLIKVN